MKLVKRCFDFCADLITWLMPVIAIVVFVALTVWLSVLNDRVASLMFEQQNTARHAIAVADTISEMAATADRQHAEIEKLEHDLARLSSRNDVRIKELWADELEASAARIRTTIASSNIELDRNVGYRMPWKRDGVPVLPDMSN